MLVTGYKRDINCTRYDLVNARKVAGPIVCPNYVDGDKVEDDTVLDLREFLFHLRPRITKG